MATMGHLRLTIGYLKATVVHIRVTLSHLRVTICNFFSELHPKVRQTCCCLYLLICRFKIFALCQYSVVYSAKCESARRSARRCLVLWILMDIDVRIGELYWADVSQAAGCSCTRQPQQAGLAGVWQHYHPQGANIKIWVLYYVCISTCFL